MEGGSPARRKSRGWGKAGRRSIAGQIDSNSDSEWDLCKLRVAVVVRRQWEL
jgi:hypothetical protein